MMAGSLGFAVSFFIQGSAGISPYPMVTLVSLPVGWAIAARGDEQAASRRLRARAMLVVALTFANACFWFNAASICSSAEAVTLIEPPLKILLLSAAAVICHPMVRELGGTWVSRQEAFCVREIVRRALKDGSIYQATADRLASYVAHERAGLIEDFRKQPPDVVVIDNQDSDCVAERRLSRAFRAAEALYFHKISTE